MSEFKSLLAKSYDQDVSRRSTKKLPSWKVEERKKFCDLIKREGKKSLLEIGAGTGIDGIYFKENEINVTCIDISNESVNKCIE